jgi:hypothetical protein
VDAARDIASCLGVRPYQVVVVRTQWSGGLRGEGIEEVIFEEHILPTPLVTGVANTTLTVQPIGSDEVDDVVVKEISGRYTEEYLRGWGPNGELIPEDQNFYWEIIFPRGLLEPLRRRYSVRKAPEYEADNVQWTVGLVKSGENRTRSGKVTPDE